MNCDHVAPFYRIVERFAFGNRLQRERARYLGHAAKARRILLLGDGDGRFLSRLMSINPGCEIDSIDVSRRMIALSKQRLGEKYRQSRVTLIHSNINDVSLPQASYDLVVAQFFFDCFNPGELTKLVPNLAAAMQRDACWIVSDFHQPSSGWQALHAWVWLKVMYLFFRILTGLRVNALCDYRPLLQQAGFSVVEESYSFANFLQSAVWRRT